MKKKYILLIISVITFNTFGQIYQDLSQKDIFTKGFPKIITFRGEYINSVNNSETDWIDNLYPSAGVFKKFVNVDELSNIKPETRTYATNYLTANPNKLVLNHYLGQAHLNSIIGSSDLFFPGHWLTVPGSILTNAINSSDTVIEVDDISKFTATIQSNTLVKFPVLMIVELDSNGNRLYNTAEFVTINNVSDINQTNNTITVSRASALSTAKSHPAGAAVVPMTSRLGKPTSFDFNLSIDCPKDSNGKTAADIILEELTSFHQSGGLLEFTQGIAFDILPFNPRDGEADVNNDNISDNGVVNQQNRYAIGAYALMTEIRTMLTDSKLMLSDGYITKDQRVIGVFDGIESEGLVKVADAYRGFSKTINVFSYWNQANTRPYNFSYIVPKFNNELDAANPNDVINGLELGVVGKINLERLTKGTAVVLGAGYTRPHNSVTSDEDLGGTLQQENWLGKPLDTLIRIAKTTPDVLNGAGTNTSNWSAVNATLSTNASSELVVTGNSSNTRDNIEVTYNNLNIGNADDDIVIYVEIQSLEPLADFPTNIPRIVQATATNLPTLEVSNRDNNFHNDLWGFADTAKTRLLSFYYRKAGGRDLDFTLNIENNGDFIIRSMTAHVSAQLLAREFENGVVLVNPSLNSKTFSLNALFPDKKFAKINGNIDTSHNSGEVITQSSITVPAKDAYFLKNSLTIVSNGTGGGNWADTTTWTGGVVPTSSDDVTIADGDLVNVFSTGATANSVTTSSINSKIVIRREADLTIAGTLDNSLGNVNTILLQADGNSVDGIQRTGTLIVGGSFSGFDIKVRQFLPNNNAWTLISAPLTSVAMTNFRNNAVTLTNSTNNTNLQSLAIYNDNNATGSKYVYFDTTAGATGGIGTNQLGDGVGYSILLNDATSPATPEMLFVGAYQTNDVDITLTDSSDANSNGFNLIGNPYTSFLYGNTLTNATNNLLEANVGVLEEQTIWLWDSSGTGNFVTKNMSDNPLLIAPTQGFFVQSNVTGGTFSFTEAMQTHSPGTSDVLLKSANNRFEIDLSIASGKNSAHTSVRYIDNTSTGFDNGYDSSIFKGISSPLSIYTKLVDNNTDKKLAIQSLPNDDYENMIIPIEVKATSGVEITFTTETLNVPAGYNVYLEDRVNNTFTPLDGVNASYKTTLNNNLSTGRFFLHTSTSSVLSTGSEILTTVNIYAKDNSLKIVGLKRGSVNISLYDILGKKIIDKTIESNTSIDISLPELSTGVFIVKLETEDGSLSKKIILQ